MTELYSKFQVESKDDQQILDVKLEDGFYLPYTESIFINLGISHNVLLRHAESLAVQVFLKFARAYKIENFTVNSKPVI